MTGPLRERIIEATLAWVGTPYIDRHYPRRGVGCDCVTLLAGVGMDVGIFTADMPLPVYSNQRHFHRQDEAYREQLLRYGFTEIRNTQAQPGDVIIEVIGRDMPSSHSGIVIAHNGERPSWFVHASNQTGLNRVCRFRINDSHWRRMRYAFRFPGVGA